MLNQSSLEKTLLLLPCTSSSDLNSASRGASQPSRRRFAAWIHDGTRRSRAAVFYPYPGPHRRHRPVTSLPPASHYARSDAATLWTRAHATLRQELQA